MKELQENIKGYRARDTKVHPSPSSALTGYQETREEVETLTLELPSQRRRKGFEYK